MEVVLDLDLHYWWTLHKSFPYTFLIEGFIGSLSRLSPYCSPFCKYLIQFNPLHLTFPLQSTNPEVGKQFKLDRPIKSVQSEAVVQRCSVKKMFLEILQNSLEKICTRVSLLIKLQTLDLRCFPVNFAKFLRTPFLTEHRRWLNVILKIEPKHD